MRGTLACSDQSHDNNCTTLWLADTCQDIERRWHSTPVVEVLDMTAAAVPLGFEKAERSGTVPSL